MSVSIDAAIAALREANPVPAMEALRSMAAAAVILEGEANRAKRTTDTTGRGETQTSELPATRLTELDRRSGKMTELKSKDSAPVLVSGLRGLIVSIAAGAIVIAGAVLLRATDNTTVAAPATSATSTTAMGEGVPVADYVIDLNTREMTPLPAAILSSLDPEKVFNPPARGRYAASSNGSMIAYIGTGSDGSLEVFVADIDGTGVRQVTHHPTDAISPTWSPDGAMIAYVGSEGLFLLDLATGESTQVPGAPPGAWGPQFTPDGSSLLYTGLGDPNSLPPGETSAQAILSTVPIEGGMSTVLIGQEQRMGHAGGGSMSPDGSLVTMLGHKINGPGAGLFLATTDGSEPRSMGLHSGNCRSYPAGAWSPDGRRIVCSGDSRDVLVVNVATGDASRVAEGTGAIWLDDHTLLVDT